MLANYIQVVSVQIFHWKHANSLQADSAGCRWRRVGGLHQGRTHPAQLCPLIWLWCAFCLEQVHLVNGTEQLCSPGGLWCLVLTRKLVPGILLPQPVMRVPWPSSQPPVSWGFLPGCPCGLLRSYPQACYVDHGWLVLVECSGLQERQVESPLLSPQPTALLVRTGKVHG